LNRAKAGSTTIRFRIMVLFPSIALDLSFRKRPVPSVEMGIPVVWQRRCCASWARDDTNITMMATAKVDEFLYYTIGFLFKARFF
jgi:hypothetical protein